LEKSHSCWEFLTHGNASQLDCFIRISHIKKYQENLCFPQDFLSWEKLHIFTPFLRSKSADRITHILKFFFETFSGLENFEISAVKPADLSQDDSQVDLCTVLGVFTLTKRYCWVQAFHLSIYSTVFDSNPVVSLWYALLRSIQESSVFQSAPWHGLTNKQWEPKLWGLLTVESFKQKKVVVRFQL